MAIHTENKSVTGANLDEYAMVPTQSVLSRRTSLLRQFCRFVALNVKIMLLTRKNEHRK